MAGHSLILGRVCSDSAACRSVGGERETHLVVVKTSPPTLTLITTTSGSACGGGGGERVCGSCGMLEGAVEVAADALLSLIL